MRRAIWLVLDSFGLGAAPDAALFGDEGADTYGHIVAACAQASRGPLRLPNMDQLGLAHAHAQAHGLPAPKLAWPHGCWGHAIEQSAGKDTPSGHWESMGVILHEPFGFFPPGDTAFSAELLAALIREADLPGVLGNCHASGTEIIARLGAEHMSSGKPIVYTSADSVFQIAAHEQCCGLQHLYDTCAIARRLCDRWNIGRVIARPFIGTPASGFQRTGNRHDCSLPPPAPTLFDIALEHEREVVGIGKIADIFAHRGISRSVTANGHDALFDATLAAMDTAADGALIATNFVDFDSVYGHRRDVFGYAAALEAFDARLPQLYQVMQAEDLLVLSADHGCDPTWPGSDHTREASPVLAFGRTLTARAIGQRMSFADIGQSLAHHLRLPRLGAGVHFLDEACV